MKRADKCMYCKYWKMLVGIQSGYCRRYPPNPNEEGKVTKKAPKTRFDWWCGEFTKKE